MSSEIAPKLNTPEVPVSWGELLDKITILEIKSVRLKSEVARENVRKELNLLSVRAIPLMELQKNVLHLKAKLTSVNEALWEIEDQIREKEAHGVFDEGFIKLARAVYITNDERARIKREINTLSSSDLIEEKGYADYSSPQGKGD